MDPITHAAAGAVLACALQKRPATKCFIPLAALVAASPDIDIIFATTPLNFLLLHRGITHAFVAVPFMALLFALCMYPLWNSKTKNAWTYKKTVLFTTVLLFLHIWLDCITTYGTMAFLPFSEYRVRLNAVFIIDFLLTLPLLAACYWGLKQKKWAMLALIWIFIYPTACIALRYCLEHAAFDRLKNKEGQDITQLTVLPDAFAPFYWRLIYEDNTPFEAQETSVFSSSLPVIKSNTEKTVKDDARQKSLPHSLTHDTIVNINDFQFTSSEKTVWHQGLNGFGDVRTAPLVYPALTPLLGQSLSKQSLRGLAYLQFSLMPIFKTRTLTVQDSTFSLHKEEIAVYDLRFDSMLPWVKKRMHQRNDGQPTFLFLGQVQKIKNGTKQPIGQSTEQGADESAKHKTQQNIQWTAVRLIFSASGKDSLWQQPVAPKPLTWWQWLLGSAPRVD